MFTPSSVLFHQQDNPQGVLKYLQENKLPDNQLHPIILSLLLNTDKEIVESIFKQYPSCHTWINSKSEIPLFTALLKNSNTIDLLLEKSDLSYKTISGDTVLHYICKSPIKDKKKYIQKVVASNMFLIQSENEIGETPLHYLAATGTKEEVAYLLSLGATKTYLTKTGSIPLIYALEAGNTEAAILLSEELSTTVDSDNGEDAEDDEKEEKDDESLSGDSLSSDDDAMTVSVMAQISKAERHKNKKKGKKDSAKKVSTLEDQVQQILSIKKPTNLIETAKKVSKKEKYKILSIDGGGMKGILEAILLSRIVKKHPKFLKKVNLVCGCSVGSILASFLVCGYDPDTCSKLLELISEKLFVNPNLTLNEAKYETKSLQFILEKVFEDTRIKDVKCHFLVDSFLIDPETNPRECKACAFTNLEKGYENEKLSDICLRSAAAPTYFHPYQNYVDGGILNNTPVGVSWAYLFGEQGLQLDPKNVVCFSLSAGKPDPYYIDINKIGNGGLVQWATQISDTFMYATRSWSVKEGGIYLGDRWLRFDPPLGRIIKLDQIELIPELKEIANNVDLTVVDKWLEKYWD
ncbi:hypothetical protein EIN_470250 [Entamoeba invadens IP1]|uniref:phospholipase A2 n=1 Tax=Entamoeba invadens IP1 TaxID=370355 RepID=A0A0A1TZ21_ENTIV|nr:hypothetical protein EIN_470250 [Entamoeba invadens IP1]ELP83781.1 hypothetical protein EIN_470250 [Entamoeba invadens IP1]|eukprot:XP_004183127.1 hypothetical protein EIN_470250 [Entamoeba invadens IP1]